MRDRLLLLVYALENTEINRLLSLIVIIFNHKVVDEDIRPPQLLFEMAPKRSGFHWRVESLNASVWSALIRGRKRWGLYPPSQFFIPGL